jgi:hypothetical protein
MNTKEVWHNLLLAVGLLFSGVITTLTAKAVNSFESLGNNGEIRYC